VKPCFGNKMLLLRPGILLLLALFIASCQRTPAGQPSPTPNLPSTIVFGRPTKVVLHVTPTPAKTVNEKLTDTKMPTNNAPSLPDAVVANGIQISLEQVEEIESGYILTGSISKDPRSMLTIYLGPGTRLLDAQGEVIPTKRYWGQGGGTLQDASAHWGLQTEGKNYPAPWRLNIPSLLIELTGKVSFAVDLGPVPQIGQTWDLNTPFDFAGHKLVVQKVEMIQSEKSRPCLAFTFAGDPEIFRIRSVSDPENRSVHIDGHVSDADSGTISSSFCYDQVPLGTRSIDVYLVDILHQGPWLLGWRPPE
jgi:hypothetical protein